MCSFVDEKRFVTLAKRKILCSFWNDTEIKLAYSFAKKE